MGKNNFDFLRFFLAFVVVVSHIDGLSGISQFHFLGAYLDGNLAIDGFFVVSGFLIISSYINTKNIGKYLIKRVKRVYPGYIILILICAAFLSLISSYSLSQYFTHPVLYKYLISNLLFLNYIQPCLPGVFSGNVMCAIDGALWTLKVEVSFYLVVPLLVYFFRKTSRKYILFFVIYVLSIGYRYYMDYLGDTSGKNLYYMLGHQLPGFMSYFVSGIALYYYHSVFVKYQSKWIIPVIVILSIEYYFRLNVLSPFALACILFYVAFNFKWLNNFGKYGDFTYGIYIYHFPIIQLFVFFGLFRNYNPWIVFIITLGTVFLAGYISWNLVEKKFLKR